MFDNREKTARHEAPKGRHAYWLVRTPLILLAAILVALGGLFFHSYAPPASAQSASPVWEAMLTPKFHTSATHFPSETPITARGCFRGRTVTATVPCDDQLTDNEFTVGGATYSFTDVYWSQHKGVGRLQAILNAVPNAELQSLSFCVGPNAFRIDSDKLIVNTYFDAGWTTDVPTPLSIGEHCSRPVANSSLTLTTNQVNNRFTEGAVIVITGKLDQAVSAPTDYTASVQGRTAWKSPGISLGSSTAGVGRIASGQDTFKVHLHTHGDDNPGMTETIGVIVKVDNARDGTFSLTQTIPITIVEDDSCEINITASDATPTEGEEVSLTIEHRDTNMYSSGLLVNTTTAGTARREHFWLRNPGGGRDMPWYLGLDGVASEEWEDWDYNIDASSQVQVVNFLNRFVLDRTYNSFILDQPRTLHLQTRKDDIADDGETVIITAEAPNSPGCRGTLTLTIRDASGQQAGGQQDGGQGGSCENCGTGGDTGAVSQDQSQYADLIAKMYDWRNDPQWVDYKSHTDRWDRALLAFGEAVSDSSLTAMTAAEAQAFADSGMTRWVEVAAALQERESAGQQQQPAQGQEPPAQPPVQPNRAPTVSGAMADVTITSESGTRQASLSGVFDDADGDSLTISAASSNDAVATVTVASDGTTLTVSAQSRGTATITATADDGNGGTVEDSFTVTVKAAPVVSVSIADLSDLEAGTSRVISLSGVFDDGDGDSLTVTAASSNGAVATVAVASGGASITVSGVAEGTATITVTAEDSDGNRVSDTFDVEVVKAPEPAPETSDIVERYDANGDGRISKSERQQALDDFYAGKLTQSELIEVIKAYAASSG